jgi:hypothetical protein
MQVCNVVADTRARAGQDILIAVTDGLKGGAARRAMALTCDTHVLML